MIQRMGFYTGIHPGKTGKKRIWIHALSMGEVKSAIPLVEILRKKNSEADIIFTISTKTGFDLAESLFSRKPSLKDIETAYFPFDFIFSVKRVISLINPDLVILVESDIWPNFLWVLHSKKIPVCLVNARMSDRSQKGYLHFRHLFKNVFSRFTMIFAQTKTDAEKFTGLGVPAGKIFVTGNIKFDQKQPLISHEKIASWRNLLDLSEKKPVIIAGSTHPGEEKSLADFYTDIKKEHPGMILILAPRNPERACAIADDYMRKGIDVSLLTDIEKGKKPLSVIIVDRLGILAEMYALADIAFIGGSMVPEGGHNPLEPACFCKPILFGPNMTDFTDIADMLISGKGALIIHNTEELCHAVHILMKDDAMRKTMGNNAAGVFHANSGATLCTLTGLQAIKTF